MQLNPVDLKGSEDMICYSVFSQVARFKLTETFPVDM